MAPNLRRLLLMGCRVSWLESAPHALDVGFLAVSRHRARPVDGRF